MLEKPKDLELRATRDHFGHRSPGGTCLARTHCVVERMSKEART